MVVSGYMTGKREIAIIFAALLIFSSMAFAASLPTILVDKVDPQPAEPGKDITVDVTFFNKETRETGDFSVVFEASYPIILKSSTEDLRKVNLCGGCSKKNKYFLIVDSSAVSATYPVYIKVMSSGSEISQRVDIKVKGVPNLVFSTDSVGLDNVTPNSKFSIVLDVKNIGSGQARQIKIQSESTDFIVLGSAVKTLDVLGPNQTKQITFDFLSSSSLTANSYAIPFRFYYLDDEGNTINNTQNLGLRVVNKGDVTIQTIKIVSNTGSTLIPLNQPFTVVIRLENIGEGTADFISSDVYCPFSEPKKSYLGQLKKDEDAPLVFDMISKLSGVHTCNLTISYKDDTGSYTISDKFNVNIQSAEYFGMVVILIIIIVVALFIFRKKVPGLKNL